MLLALSFTLFGCNNFQEIQDTETSGNHSSKKEEHSEQKVVIMDSIEAPLPPEAENIQSMPRKSEPQQLPNANLDDPMVITKMPYSEVYVLK